MKQPTSPGLSTSTWAHHRSHVKEAKKRKQIMEEMSATYTAEGIVTLAGSRLYTSAEDTDEIIDEALVRFEGIFQNIEGV